MNPALTKLRDEVQGFDWIDPKLGKIIEFAVMPVGDGNGFASIVVHHANDIVKHGGGTIEFLKAELDRFSHPSIRY